MSLRRKVMPSMRGISRSSVRTSGLRWTMRSRATKGSGAAPTTSISGSFASSREKIWRTTAESSTTRTRVTAPPCYLALRLLQPRSLLPPTHAQRQVDAVAVLVHHRARGGGGGQRALVLLARHLAHPRQSQAAGLLAEQLDDEGAGDHVQHLTHPVAVVPGACGPAKESRASITRPSNGGGSPVSSAKTKAASSSALPSVSARSSRETSAAMAVLLLDREQALDHSPEMFRPEGFLHVGGGAALLQRVDARLASLGRDDDHRRGRQDLIILHRLHQLEPGHLGHVDVGEHDVHPRAP